MRQGKKILSFHPPGDSGAAELDGAIRAWRALEKADGGGERLSNATRARILGQAGDADESRPTPFASLFVPTRRLALAGVVPLLVLSLAMGYLLIDPVASIGGGDPAVRLEVSKQGEDVVFLIANGERPHRVYRSTRPNAVPDELYVTAQRAFRDRLDSRGDVVYYRID